MSLEWCKNCFTWAVLVCKNYASVGKADSEKPTYYLDHEKFKEVKIPIYL
jgi:hypothetical protein